MQARQNLVGQLGVERCHQAVESVFQNILNLFPQPRVVAFARDVYQAGNITPERIAAYEHGNFLTFLQMQDAHRHFAQFLLADLKQFVPGSVSRIWISALPS